MRTSSSVGHAAIGVIDSEAAAGELDADLGSIIACREARMRLSVNVGK